MLRPAFALLAISAVATGCSEPTAGSGTDAGTDSGIPDAGAPCDPSTRDSVQCCMGGCGSDVGGSPVCVDGTWQCGENDATPAQCADAGLSYCMQGLALPSSLKPCVDRDAGMCLGGCEPNEVCFTQESCTVLPDGGSQCSVGGPGKGDDLCHRLCTFGCVGTSGEACLDETFFGCSDAESSRRICCGGDAGC